MFSYRHAFHAGNHADVLKHTVLIAVLRHLMQKEASIQYTDTHAGAGLYRLDGDYAEKSGEASKGVLKVIQAKQALTSPILLDYLEMVNSFNSAGKTRVYPGSPFIIHQLLRHDSRDRLKLYELHPTDHKALVGNVAQLEAGRAIQIKSEDGFEALKTFLPPPARRAMVMASAAAVPSSSSDALASGRPVRSLTSVWKLSRACRRPCEISGWYGVYDVYQAGFSMMLRSTTGGVAVPW